MDDCTLCANFSFVTNYVFLKCSYKKNCLDSHAEFVKPKEADVHGKIYKTDVVLKQPVDRLIKIYIYMGSINSSKLSLKVRVRDCLKIVI